MPNVREKIEIVYAEDGSGRTIKHPSGMEVFESTAELQARFNEAQATIDKLQKELNEDTDTKDPKSIASEIIAKGGEITKPVSSISAEAVVEE